MPTGTIGAVRYTYDQPLATVDDDGVADLAIEARWFTGDPPGGQRLAAPMDLALWLDREAHVVHLPVVGDHLEHRGWQLRQVTPVVAACFDRLTLHASAVGTDAGVIAFVGGSGVGKSTLAWEVVKAGAEPVSDDLLPIRFADDEPFVPTGQGERRIAWIGFPARHDGGLEIRPLTPVEVLERHLHNGFGEHGDPDVWAFQFDASHRLATSVEHNELLVPDDRSALGEVVAHLLRVTAGEETR